MLQVGPGLARNIFLAVSCSSMNKAVVSHVTRRGLWFLLQKWPNTDQQKWNLTPLFVECSQRFLRPQETKTKAACMGEKGLCEQTEP